MTETTNEQPQVDEQPQEAQYRPDVEITSQRLSDEELFGEQPNDDEQLGDDENQEPLDDEIEKKPKNKVQARIDEITKEKKEAQEELARARAEIEALKQANIKQEQPLVEPDAIDYDSDEDYRKALIDYGQQIAERKVRQELQIKPKIENYNTTLAKVKEANADFQRNLDALNDSDAPSDAQTLSTFKEALIDSEHGAFLLNEIVKDKYNAINLLKLAKNDTAKFHREIGKIEARLSLEKSKSTVGLGNKQKYKPIDPVRSNGAIEKSINEMSSEEYASYRRKQGSKVF